METFKEITNAIIIKKFAPHKSTSRTVSRDYAHYTTEAGTTIKGTFKTFHFYRKLGWPISSYAARLKELISFLIKLFKS